MKNTFSLSIMLFAFLCGRVVEVQAVGDTIRTMPRNFFYSRYLSLDTNDPTFYKKLSTVYQYEHEESWNSRYHSDSIESVWGVRNGNHIVGVQMVTDRALKIVGIAACGYMQEPRDTTINVFRTHLMSTPDFCDNMPQYCFCNTRDTSRYTRITDSLILYKPTPDGLVKLMSAPWRIEQQHRNIILPPYAKVNSNGQYLVPRGIDPSPVVPLYEAWFAKPVIVEDSFMVAGTALNNDGSYGWVSYLNDNLREWMWLWDHNPTRYWNLAVYEDTSTYLLNQEHWVWWRKHRHHPWVGGAGYYGATVDNNHFACRNTPIIFPIIDTTYDSVPEHCHPVSNIRIASCSNNSATIIWDADNSIRWEVKYGMVGMDDSNYTVISTVIPTATLTDLVEGLQYKAYVRGWCPCDSSWSEWTGMRAFSLNHGGSIAQPDLLGRFTQLMPNPARGAVSVVSSFALRRIVLYDLSGRCVLEQDTDGISAIVDLSTLSPGTYIAALHTSLGIATKKLLVK